MYSEKVLDHFYNPKNMGEMENPDVTVRVGNPVCGDVMEMYLDIDTREDGEEYIEDIKFKTLGCGAAIATSSMATELVKGKTLDEAVELSNEALSEALGGLPPTKEHCSVLAADAVKKAIKKYREEKRS
ncbi:MAG: iron-sulfur cluster assembly scaffold protein [Patescibacteria group bacterium]